MYHFHHHHHHHFQNFFFYHHDLVKVGENEASQEQANVGQEIGGVDFGHREVDDYHDRSDVFCIGTFFILTKEELTSSVLTPHI